MKMVHRLILTAALMAGLVPVMAQVPPPVPGLPDTERRTSYTLAGTNCACSVGFALYGDSTDYQDWLEVFINGVQVTYNDPVFGWTIASPTGPLANIARPITDGVLTFNSVQTGTIQIVGARRPRRVSQFNENTGVPARNLNQALTDMVAMLREDWDKINDVTGRVVRAPPGETLKILPAMSNRLNQGACFDSGGNLTNCVAVPTSSLIQGANILLSGTNPTTISAVIPAPGASTLGGVNTADCSLISGFIQKINPDGSITCVVPSGGGLVSVTGTPTANQFAEWTNATTVQGVSAAAKSDLQTGTSTTKPVTPAQQQSHDSANKVAGFCSVSGTTVTCPWLYNVSSVTRSATGQFLINFSTAFASTSYGCQGSATAGSTNVEVVSFGQASYAVGQISAFVTQATAFAAADPAGFSFACQGRQ